jgi:general nucleoside transport system permease protein
VTPLRAVANGLLLPALALLTAMVVGGVVIVVSNPDTFDSFSLGESWQLVVDSYRALFRTSLGSTSALGRTLREATPLLFGGLSVALAFRAGLFNIGGAGQLIAGATVAGYVGFTYDLPTAVHLPLAVGAGFAGGAVWGAIAGVLKARTGAHEVITTIMLNFVAIRLLDWLLTTSSFQRSGRDDPISPQVHESARLPRLGGDLVTTWGLVLALATAVGVWWLLARSTTGFRMRAVGANPFAARYAGMAVAGTYVLSMVLAGGLAGVAGAVNVLGVPSYSLTPGYYAFIGFDSIAVALLGRANPIGVVGASLLFGVLRAGALGMQTETSTPVDIIVVIQALIIAFVAAPALIRAIWRIRADRVGRGQSFTTGWGSA